MSKPLVFALGVLTGIAVSAAIAIGGLVLVGKQLAADLGGAPSEGSPAGLAGTYACDGCVYDAVEFREGGHAVVHGMGMAFPTTYSRAGDRVYVTSDKGDLGFVVVDASTLEGEGWAAGTYYRR